MPRACHEQTHETFNGITIDEILKSLSAEDEENLVELYGEFRCEFMDTIISTEKMRAGLEPYVETGGPSKYSPDDHWGTTSEEVSEDSSESLQGEYDSNWVG